MKYINIIIIFIDKPNFLNKYYNTCITEKLNNLNFHIKDIKKCINSTIIYKYSEYKNLDLYYPLGFINIYGIKYYFEINKNRKYNILKKELYNYKDTELIKILIKLNYDDYKLSSEIVNELIYLTQKMVINNIKTYNGKNILYNKIINTKDKLIKIIDIILTLIKNKKIDDFNIIFYTFNNCIEKISYYIELICNYNISENIKNDKYLDEIFHEYHINYKNKNNLSTELYLDCMVEWDNKTDENINNYNIISTKDIGGYLYILQEREFFRLNEKVFKIGCTKDYKKRLTHYPKGSILVFIIFNNNYKYSEKVWINKLNNNNKLIKRRDIGFEYFEGNPIIIIKDLFNIIGIIS